MFKKLIYQIGEKGIALPLVLLIVLVLLPLGLCMSYLIKPETRMAVKGKTSTQAFQISDAGINLSIAKIIDDENYTGPETQTLATGSFTVSVSTPGTNDSNGNLLPANAYEIVSTGYTPEITNWRERKRIITRIIRDDPSDSLDPIFDYAIASKDPISLSGNAQTDSIPTAGFGNVYCGNDITMSGNAEINGSANCVGNLGMSGNANVTGATNTGVASLTFPTINTSGFITDAQAGGTMGNYSLSGNNSATIGPIYINGNLTVSGNAQLTLQNDTVVYVTGKVTVSGNGKIGGKATICCVGDVTYAGNTTAGTPLVMSTSGDIKITGNAHQKGIFYCPNGTITASGNGNVIGAMVGKEVKVTGNGKAIYDQDLENYGLPVPGEEDSPTVKIISWHEVKIN